MNINLKFLFCSQMNLNFWWVVMMAFAQKLFFVALLTAHRKMSNFGINIK